MIDNSGAMRKTEDFLAALQERVASSTEGLARVLQLAAAERAPTPEAEYRALMLGEGGESYDIPELAGYRSADDDTDEPGRVRFEKTPGTFIQELTLNPENVFFTETTAAVGNSLLLLAGSTYVYKDYVPTKRPRKGVTYNTGTFTVGPYFEAFEYGSSSTSGWRETVQPIGKGYPLRPDGDPKHRPMSMSKPIEARFMYSPVDLETVARRYLDGILANEGHS